MEDICQAAIEEFVDKGYEKSSMDDIAKRAGVSKGGLYHHFKSKEEIVLMANHKLSEPLGKFMMNSLGMASAVKGLTNYISEYFDYWSMRKRELIFIFLSITKVLNNADLRQEYQRYVDQILEFYQTLYQKGIDAGEFVNHSAFSSAVTLMGAMDGIIGYPLFSDRFRANDLKIVYIEKFVESLTPAYFKLMEEV